MAWALRSVTKDSLGGGIRVRLRPLEVRSTANSAFPVDRSNGTLWSGRGLSSMGSAGVDVRFGPIKAAVAPNLAVHQNLDFEIQDTLGGNRSPFAYPWHGGNIDWPQRFGNQSFSTIDPGQSYLRADVGRFSGGVSNENLWWGPSVRYPLILGNTAPGFAHLFLGTREPISLGVATLEAWVVMGELSESEYFDDDASNDRQRLSGIILTIQPRILPGLYIGGSGLFEATRETEESGLSRIKGLLLNPFNFGGNVTGNGMGSLFARWIMPESGFETYVEWARNDGARDIEDLLLEPDHSQAYTIGFQKVTSTGAGELKVTGELTDLKSNVVDVITQRGGGDGIGTFYTHDEVPQGHTHKGQLLGSWIGPGSDAQYLSVDLFTAHGRYGVFIERVRWDDDAYFRNRVHDYGFRGHDVEFTAGARVSRAIGDLQLDGMASWGHRKNRNFLGLDTVNFDFLREHNLHVDLSLSWWPEQARGWDGF